MRFFLLALSLFVSSVVLADDIIEDFGTWNQLNFNYKPKDSNWLGYLELQGRMKNDSKDVNQLIARPAIGYQVTPNLSLWGGYLFQATTYKGSTNHYWNEHRVFEQATYKDKFGDLDFTSRTRFEQRNFDVADSGTALRVRQQFRVDYPLHIGGTYVAAYDEVFFNLNNEYNSATNIKTGFDQNRAWVGLGYKFNDHFKAETGYLNQYQEAVGGPNKMNHIIMTAINASF
ncbi:MAG: DUF2490 domain-containing protein [Candidatus Nitrosotenuis sp.]